jgi:hypothetical protein
MTSSSSKKLPRWRIRNKSRFLEAVLTELAGDARVSFEGSLENTRLMGLDGATTNETAALKRNTTWPVQDFVIVPLGADRIDGILRAIGMTISRTILHIQVERAGKLEFGLYDNPSSGMPFLGSAFSAEFVKGLESLGIVETA